MNSWMLTGRLTKDPETKAINEGNLVSTINIASRRNYKNKDSNEYESDFFRLKAFGKTADYMYSSLKKGCLVEVTATVKNNNYEKNGEKIYRDEYMIVNITKLLNSKEGESK